MLSGEIPEWIPEYTFGVIPGAEPPASVMAEPEILVGHRINGGGPDHWGVNHIPTYETGNALIPEPNNFILRDIREWRDVIKAPRLDGIDWEAMVKRDIGRVRINRAESALAMNLHVGYFQNLMEFMGFSEGLTAMIEEPEEVHALLDYMCDFYMSVAERTIDLFKPDVLTFMDDTAAWAAPFISRGMYEEFLVPRHSRWAKMGLDRGLPMTMHNCGKCEGILDLLVDMGITMWEPAQTCNDLLGIRKRFGNKLCVAGGWDGRGRLLAPDVTDEEIRQSARDTMDALAPGGGYAWCGMFLGPLDDPETARRNEVLTKEAKAYARAFYKR
jgi:hypothetical protein